MRVRRRGGLRVAVDTKELPAAVQPFLQKKGYWDSGNHIMQLGHREEFESRRRPPGKTVASERRKK